MVGTIEVRGLADVMRFFRSVGKVADQVADRGLSRCGVIAQREAVRNAPRSPTKAQYSATLKRKKRTDRKNFHPGGLEKSIELFKDGHTLTLAVRENSYAGKYAAKIHDFKGITWRNRGPGTIAKGRRADDRFIARAITDNEETFTRIMENELQKAMRGL